MTWTLAVPALSGMDDMGSAVVVVIVDVEVDGSGRGPGVLVTFGDEYFGFLDLLSSLGLEKRFMSLNSGARCVAMKVDELKDQKWKVVHRLSTSFLDFWKLKAYAVTTNDYYLV